MSVSFYCITVSSMCNSSNAEGKQQGWISKLKKHRCQSLTHSYSVSYSPTNSFFGEAQMPKVLFSQLFSNKFNFWWSSNAKGKQQGWISQTLKRHWCQCLTNFYSVRYSLQQAHFLVKLRRQRSEAERNLREWCEKLLASNSWSLKAKVRCSSL
jgi:hypothetical protein